MTKRFEASIDDLSFYVDVEGNVIVEAGLGEECHSKSNPCWEIAAKVVLKLREEKREEYTKLLGELRKTALEYFKLKEAIKLTLTEDNERKTIMAEL